MTELHVDVRVRGGRALQLRSEADAVGIVGPSGVGKSTLLRVLAGVEPRVTGTVRARGETWLAPGVEVPAWLRRVGWVPQDGLLFPHLTVRENLAYAAQEDVVAVAGLLGVAPLLDRSPRHLSGGERQRVALGRALASAPRLLLLDEPFAALDRALRARLAEDVAAWCQQRRLPVVLVTHDESDLVPFVAERWVYEEAGLTPGRSRPG